MRVTCQVLSSQSAESLYIWYDYFSCPQLGKDGGDLRRAIDSIPSYITRSDLFLALNPAIEGGTLDEKNRRQNCRFLFKGLSAGFAYISNFGLLIT